MRQWLVGLFALFVFTAPALAQAPPETLAQRRGEMAKLAGLVGAWAGPGWRLLPDGARVEYDQTVLVTSKMNGLALTIEGKSQRRGPNAPPPGAGSLALITWELPGDAGPAGRYAFRSFSTGSVVDSDGALLAPDTFQWIYRGPPAWLRFTVVFQGASWKEVGERSLDAGKTWIPTYGVDLTRAAP